MMTYRQIESSREKRLWITQVFMPMALATTVILSNKETRGKLKDKAEDLKNKIKAKFNK